MAHEFFIVDGLVRLSPEKDVLLREGLASWLGTTAVEVTSKRLPLPMIGDGCFNWSPHPDCTDHLYVLAKVVSADKEVNRDCTFRRNNQGDPWPIDERGISRETIELLSVLATAEDTYGTWIGQIAEAGANLGEAVLPESFARLSRQEYDALSKGQMNQMPLAA